ncbi:unnamed protein product [Echinostoma caproni]|uniref:DUF4485 domain-containing protein n=1 Tax=Echinostoma caproni TaxID=27848 RepID=A0A183B3X3_9TREM|nr:unnamed protein product [Echinostoma caproni]
MTIALSSLNEEFRKREVDRIMRDNEELFKRMKQRLTNTRRPRWEDSWANTLIYLDNISKYPTTTCKDETEQEKDRQKLSREDDKSIRPFVETVENKALEMISTLDPNHMVLNLNDPEIRRDPDYCKLVQAEPVDEPPEAVRGFVATVIQTALQHVYEQGLRSDPSKTPENAYRLLEVVRYPSDNRKTDMID